MTWEIPARRAPLPYGLTALAIYLYILGVSTPAVVASENASREVQPITKSLENNPETKLFTSGLKKSGLWDEIAGSGELTLFVPKEQLIRSIFCTRYIRKACGKATGRILPHFLLIAYGSSIT